MRKNIISRPVEPSPSSPGWWDLETLAEVDVSSESADAPIEHALLPTAQGGWRAAQPGPQIIRLRFSIPQVLRRIRLVFAETERARTQEFVLSWLTSGSEDYREIVRQQYTFSPPGTTSEREDYRVDLNNLIALELRIIPDIGGQPAWASLVSLQLASQ
jgi:hypothetical protein